MFSKLKLALCLALAFSASSFAATVGPYYVSNNPKATGSTCANGSDSNNGLSISTPFATWQQAANTISSGNTAIIYVCGGTTGGSFAGGIIAGGKDGQDSTHPIRTTSLAGERATFNAVAGRGEDTFHGWASGGATDYGFFSVTGDSDFWQFDNLNFTNTHASIPTIKALNLDDSTDQTTYRSYINTAGIFGNIIKFAVGADYFTFDSLTVTDMLFAGAGDPAIDHLTLTNSTFDDGNLNYGYHSYLSGANWSVHNNSFSNYSSYVFHINHCGGSGATDFNGGSIYNNTFSNIATKPYWQVLDGLWIHGGAALYICPLGSNNLVYNNVFYKVNYGLSIPPDGTGVALKLNNLLPQSGNVAANNTFQYGYCDVFIYMQGGNIYSNNLTGTTTIQHSASPAACSVDDYVTKNTNLTNVSTASFTNVVTGDLTLANGASAIGTATNLGGTYPALTTDKNGDSRDLPWSVGAYSYNLPPGTIQFVQSAANTNAGSTTITKALTSNTTTNDTLLVHTFWKNAVTVSSVAVSAGSATFTDCGLGRVARPTDGFVQCFIATGITGGTTPTVTVTYSGTTSFAEVEIAEYSPSSIDTGIFSSGTATSGTTVSAGVLTPLVTDGMLVSYAINNGSGFTPPGGFVSRFGATTPYSDHIYGSTVGSVTVTAEDLGGFDKGVILVTNLRPNVSSPPVPGNSGTLAISLLTSTTLTVSWTAATGTPTLSYLGCRSALPITNVGGCLAATRIFDYTSAITSYAVTGLTPLDAPHINIVVSDGNGNTALYSDVQQAIPCGATKVVFTSQPSNATLGASLGTVFVAVENASNTVCTDSAATITLSKGGGATWGTLASASSLTKTVSNGIATWTDLSVTTTTGAGVVAAASAGLTGANSSSITISSAPAPGGRRGRFIFKFVGLQYEYGNKTLNAWVRWAGYDNGVRGRERRGSFQRYLRYVALFQVHAADQDVRWQRHA